MNNLPTSLVFVDASISNYQQLMEGIDSNAEVILINGYQNGIDVITNILAQRQNLKNIQILSHGSEGALYLGNSKLDSSNLQDYSLQLDAWGKAMADGGDFLLYGCNVAAGTEGKSFVKELSQYIGRDVAASEDLTGNSVRGGDWDLEVKTGDIEGRSALVSEVRGNFAGVLGVEGLKQTYYDSRGGYQDSDIKLDTEKVINYNDRQISETWRGKKPIGARGDDDYWFTTWEGYFLPQNSSYNFTYSADDKVRFEIETDNARIDTNWQEEHQTGQYRTISDFTQGEAYHTKVSFYDKTRHARVTFQVNGEDDLSGLFANQKPPKLSIEKVSASEREGKARFEIKVKDGDIPDEGLVVDYTVTGTTGKIEVAGERPTVLFDFTDDFRGSAGKLDESISKQFTISKDPNKNSQFISFENGKYYLDIPIKDDSWYEEQGLKVTLDPRRGQSNPNLYYRFIDSNNSSAEQDIIDNDVILSLEPGNLTLTEGDKKNLTLKISNGGFQEKTTVELNTDGSSDLLIEPQIITVEPEVPSVQILVTAKDSQEESAEKIPLAEIDDEQFEILIKSNPKSYQLGDSTKTQITVEDNEPEISFSSTNIPINAAEGGATGEFTIDLSKPNPNDNFELKFRVETSSTAQQGTLKAPSKNSDYKLFYDALDEKGTNLKSDSLSPDDSDGIVDDGVVRPIRVPEGTKTIKLRVEVINNELWEPDETVKITLLDYNGKDYTSTTEYYLVNQNNKSATLTIKDNEPTVSLGEVVMPEEGFGFGSTIQGLGSAVNLYGQAYVEVPQSDKFDLSLTGQFTQEAWVYGTGSGELPILGDAAYQSDSKSAYPRLLITGDKKIHAGFGDGTNYNQLESLTDVLNPDNWNHVAATFDGTDYKIYVNGVEVRSTEEYAGKKPYNSQQFDIGRNGDSNYFQGAIDEVRLWNLARSPGDIQQGMLTPLTGEEEGLVGYWTFENNTNDSSGNDNHGTYVTPVDNDLISDVTGGYYLSYISGLYFNSNNTSEAITRSLNTTVINKISFDLLGIENNSNGVVLEYSTDGSNWQNIATYETEDYLQWTTIEETIPGKARTPSTQFRWRQVKSNDTNGDYWGLRNAKIPDLYINNPAPQIGYIEVNLDKPFEGPQGLWVNYDISGTATKNEDYFNSRYRKVSTQRDPQDGIIIPQGETSGRIYIVANPDEYKEAEEEVQITLKHNNYDYEENANSQPVGQPDQNNSNYALGEKVSETVTIKDNGAYEEKVIFLDQYDRPINDKNPLYVDASSKATLKVKLAGKFTEFESDGSINVKVGEESLTFDNNDWDEAKTITLNNLVSGSRLNYSYKNEPNGSLPTIDKLPQLLQTEEGSATDEVLVTPEVSIAKKRDVVEGDNQPGEFVINLTAPAPEEGLEVKYSVTVGTATEGEDYEQLTPPYFALKFQGDNASDRVTISNFNNFPTNALTIEGWFKNTNATTNNPPLVSYATRTDSNEFLIHSVNNQLRIFLNGDYKDTGFSIPDGEWHHWALTWSKDSAINEWGWRSAISKLYLDGQEVWSQIWTGLGNWPLQSGGTLVLGQEQDRLDGGFDKNQAYGGSISDFRVWNVVRTPEEIQANYNQQLTGEETGLVGYYPALDVSETTLNDATGNGNDGTIHGNVSWESNDIPPVFTPSIAVDPGATRTILPVFAVDDNILEDKEIVEVTLENSDGYTLNSESNKAELDITDNDSAGIELANKSEFTDSETGETRTTYSSTLTPVNTSETGTSETVGIRLTSKPTEDVTVALSNADTTEGEVTPTELTFTPDDWDKYKDVIVTGKSDSESDGDVKYEITVKTKDDNYTVPAAVIPVTNIDIDEETNIQLANKVESKDEATEETITSYTATFNGVLTSEEGTSETVGVRLPSKPTANVTVELSNVDTTEGEVNHTSLVFTPDNWNQYQDVIVTGKPDPENDKDGKDVEYNIEIKSTSNDPKYNNQATVIPVTNTNIENILVDDISDQFRGDNTIDRVVISNFANFPTDALTIEGWFKNTKTSISTPVSYAVGTGGGQDNELLLQIVRGELRVWLNSTQWKTEVPIADGEWSHLSLTWNSSDATSKVYLNGEEMASETWSQGGNTPLQSGGTLVLGQEQDRLGGGFNSQEAYGGFISDFRVWNQVRTTEEIQANYNQQLTGQEAGLVAYYPTLENNNNILSDASGNDNNGIVSGNVSRKEKEETEVKEPTASIKVIKQMTETEAGTVEISLSEPVPAGQEVQVKYSASDSIPKEGTDPTATEEEDYYLKNKLFVNSVDADGNKLFDNPFGEESPAESAKPAFGDVDGDGDTDAVVGLADGTVQYFENVDGNLVARSGINNPFNDVKVGSNAAPALADLNGDRKLDLVVGDGNGNLSYFVNKTNFTTLFLNASQIQGIANPFSGIKASGNSAPTFGDLNGDRLPDLVLGAADGSVTYYFNQGTLTAPVFNAGNSTANVGGNALPQLINWDFDKDLDIIVSNGNGEIKYLENSNATNPSFTDKGNPLAGVKVDANSALAFADFDEDGDKDIFIGTPDNGIEYVEQFQAVTFKPGEQTKQVTIQPIDDLVDEGEAESFNLSLEGNNGYQVDSESSPVQLTIEDDDTANVIVTPNKQTDTTTSEAGKTLTYTAKLNSQPTEAVQVYFGSNDDTEGILGTSESSEVELEVDNGNNPNKFPANKDALFFTGSGVRQATTQTLNATNIDKVTFDLILGNGSNGGEDMNFLDSVSLEYSTNGGSSWSKIKGFSEPFSFSGQEKYAAWTTIEQEIPQEAKTPQTQFRWRNTSSIFGGDWGLAKVEIPIDTTADVIQLEFTPDNWDEEQQFFVKGADDDIDDNDVPYQIITTVEGEDSKYRSLEIDPIYLTNNDDGDEAKLEITKMIDGVAEGRENIYKVKLSSQPAGEVRVIADPNNDQIRLNNEDYGDRMTIVFDETNWDVEQIVRVSAIDDNLVEFIHESQIDFEVQTGEYKDFESEAINDVSKRAIDLGEIKGGYTWENLGVVATDKDWFKFTLPDAATTEDFVRVNVTEGNENGLKFNIYKGDDLIEVYKDRSSEVKLDGLERGEYYLEIFSPENDNIEYDLIIGDEDYKYENYENVKDNVTSLDVQVIDNDLPTAKIISGPTAAELSSEPGYFTIMLNAPVPDKNGSTGIEVNYEIVGGTATLQTETELGDYKVTGEGSSKKGSVRIAPGDVQNNAIIVPIDDKLVEDLDLDVTNVDKGNTSNGKTTVTLDVEENNASNLALNFQGNNATDYVTIPNFNNFPTDALTIEGWFKKTQGGNGALVSYAVPGSDNEFLLYVKGSQIEITLKDHGKQDTGAEINDDGQWHHWAFTWSKSDTNTKVANSKLYFDGAKIWSGTWEGPGNTSLQQGGTLVLGQEQDTVGGGFESHQSYGGSLSEFRVWNTVRTDEEIKVNYNKPLTGSETGLVGYYPVWEGSGNKLKDLTENDNDGTIYGNVSWETDRKNLPQFAKKVETPPKIFKGATFKFLDDVVGKVVSDDVTLEATDGAFKGQVTIEIDDEDFNKIDNVKKAKVAGETVHVKLLEGEGYQLGKENTEATLAIQDDDVPGVRIVQVGENTTVGEEETATFAVSLLSEPEKPVTITLTPGAEVEFVDPVPPLPNENKVQVEKFTYSFDPSAPNSYPSEPEQEKLTTIEIGGVTFDLKLNSLVNTDRGDAVAFEIRLQNQPTQDVELTISDAYGSDSRAEKLTFTAEGLINNVHTDEQTEEKKPGNWNEWQQVTLYELDQNSSGKYAIKVNGQEIKINRLEDTEFKEVKKQTTSITIQREDWYKLQTITVRGSEDGVAEPGIFHTTSIEYEVTSEDDNYKDIFVPNQTIEVVDRVLNAKETAKGMKEGLGLLQDSIDEMTLPLLGKLKGKNPNLIGELGLDLAKNTESQNLLTAKKLKETIEGVLNNWGLESFNVLTEINEQETIIDLKLSKQQKYDVPLDVNLGMPALGLQTEGTLNADFNFDLSLTFGLHKEFGFYLDTGTKKDQDGKEIKDEDGNPIYNTYLDTGVRVDLEDFKGRGGLGFMALDFADDPDNPSELAVTFTATLNDVDDLKKKPVRRSLTSDRGQVIEGSESILDEEFLDRMSSDFSQDTFAPDKDAILVEAIAVEEAAIEKKITAEEKATKELAKEEATESAKEELAAETDGEVSEESEELEAIEENTLVETETSLDETEEELEEEEGTDKQSKNKNSKTAVASETTDTEEQEAEETTSLETTDTEEQEVEKITDKQSEKNNSKQQKSDGQTAAEPETADPEELSEEATGKQSQKQKNKQQKSDGQTAVELETTDTEEIEAAEEITDKQSEKNNSKQQKSDGQTTAEPETAVPEELSEEFTGKQSQKQKNKQQKSDGQTAAEPETTDTEELEAEEATGKQPRKQKNKQQKSDGQTAAELETTDPEELEAEEATGKQSRKQKNKQQKTNEDSQLVGESSATLETDEETTQESETGYRSLIQRRSGTTDFLTELLKELGIDELNFSGSIDLESLGLPIPLTINEVNFKEGELSGTHKGDRISISKEGDNYKFSFDGDIDLESLELPIPVTIEDVSLSKERGGDYSVSGKFNGLPVSMSKENGNYKLSFESNINLESQGLPIPLTLESVTLLKEADGDISLSGIFNDAEVSMIKEGDKYGLSLGNINLESLGLPIPVTIKSAKLLMGSGHISLSGIFNDAEVSMIKEGENYELSFKSDIDLQELGLPIPVTITGATLSKGSEGISFGGTFNGEKVSISKDEDGNYQLDLNSIDLGELGLPLSVIIEGAKLSKKTRDISLSGTFNGSNVSMSKKGGNYELSLDKIDFQSLGLPIPATIENAAISKNANGIYEFSGSSTLTLPAEDFDNFTEIAELLPGVETEDGAVTISGDIAVSKSSTGKIGLELGVPALGAMRLERENNKWKFVALEDGDRLTLADFGVVATNDEYSFPDLINYEFKGEANLGLKTETSVQGNPAFPSFKADVAVEMPELFNYSNQEKAKQEKFNVFFNNMELDLGSFLSDFAKPVIAKVDDLIDPIKPVVKALNADTKFLSKLGLEEIFDKDGKDGVSVLEMTTALAEISGGSVSGLETAAKFANAIDDIVNIVDVLGELPEDESIIIPLGNYNLNGLKAASQDPNHIASNQSGNLKQTAPNNEPAWDEKSSSLKKAYETLTGLKGIEIALIQNPENAAFLLIGKDADIIKYDIPDLNFNLEFEKEYPFWTPPTISALLGGNFSAKTDLAIGFDTHGVNEWSKEHDFDPAKAYLVFDGFYLDDLDKNKKDKPELSLDGEIYTGLNVSVGVAKAALQGGIDANVDLDIEDVGEKTGNSDGKIRGSEIISRIENPLSLFDLYGDIGAFLKAKVDIFAGFGYKTVWQKKFARFQLAEFRINESGVSGSALNGKYSTSYIAGATVFLDGNFNGLLDDNEPVTKTDSNGNYNLEFNLADYDTNGNGQLDDDEGQIITMGGVDTSSGAPITTQMVGSVEESLLTPLTHLENFLVEEEYVESEKAAEKLIVQKLDLPSVADLADDPIANIADGESNKVSKAGVEVYLAHVKVQNLIVHANALLQGANPKSDFLYLEQEVVTKGLAEALTSERGDFDLSNAEDVEAILTEIVAQSTEPVTPNAEEEEGEKTAQKLGKEIAPEIIQAAAEMLAEANALIDEMAAEAEKQTLDLVMPVVAPVKRTTQGELTEITEKLGAGELTPETAQEQFTTDLEAGNRLEQQAISDTRNVKVYSTEDGEIDENSDGDIEIVIELGEPSPSQGVNILYNISGTATEGEDYQIKGLPGDSSEIYIEAGKTEKKLTISPIDDEISELTETITLNLRYAAESFAIDSEMQTAVVQIIDNEEQTSADKIQGKSEEGTVGDDTLIGTENPDNLSGGYGSDFIEGDASPDILQGNHGQDTIIGGSGSDIIEGNYGDDYLEGNEGNDQISGGAGDDEISAGAGNDEISGSADNDQISGDEGNDNIQGNEGDDIISGDADNDWLQGGTGNDILTGGDGKDVVHGGDGADYFVFESPDQALDIIVDFDPSKGDKIIIDAAGFNNPTLDDFQFLNGYLYFQQKQIALIQNEGVSYNYFSDLSSILEIKDTTTLETPESPEVQPQEPQNSEPVQKSTRSNIVTRKQPGNLLAEILQRGVVKVGVLPSLRVYQNPENDEARGTGIELGKALASALFGDEKAVEYVVLDFDKGFEAVANKEVDIADLGATHNLVRDALLNIDFSPTRFYDGGGIMVKADSGINHTQQLEGLTIAVYPGSTTEQNLKDFLAKNGIDALIKTFTDTDEKFAAYESGEIDAIADDLGFLATYIRDLPVPEKHKILDEEISKEPLGLILPENESEWADVVRWVTYVPIQAEEFNITSENIDQVKATSNDPAKRRFLGLEGNLGETLGLPNNFAENVIKSSGNFQEIYDRAFPNLDRNRNHLWTNEGLHYSPPFSGTIPSDTKLINNDERGLLQEILNRGRVKVGMIDNNPGFAQEIDGQWQGFDVDLARALGAALFGDPERVEFVKQGFTEGFPNVANGEVDVSAMGVTHNLVRDAAAGIDYSPTYLYTGAGILVRNNSGITSLSMLNGRKIGMFKGTTAKQSLEDALARVGGNFIPVEYTTDEFTAYDNGEVDAVIGDLAVIASKIPTLSNPSEHRILNEFLSKEPLALVIDENQSDWADVVRWVTHTLVQAEEFGITQENVDDLVANSNNLQIRRFLGLEENLGETLGLPNDYAVQIIKAVGNYGEVYDRHFDSNILPRGTNELFTNFGLQYAYPLGVPPITEDEPTVSTVEEFFPQQDDDDDDEENEAADTTTSDENEDTDTSTSDGDEENTSTPSDEAGEQPIIDPNDPQKSPEDQREAGKVMWGTDVTDTMSGASGNDWLHGMRDDDMLMGYAGEDTAYGGKGQDIVMGGDHGDLLYGDNDNDIVEGEAGNDQAHGNRGLDFVNGGDGDDMLRGGKDADRILGGIGNDNILGEKGNDLLEGNEGDDLLDGGEGDNTLSGGQGSDRFVLAPGNGSDIILDFEDGIDLLQLEDGIAFADLIFTEESGSAVVEFNSERLAVVSGVAPSLLTAEDFLIPES